MTTPSGTDENLGETGVALLLAGEDNIPNENQNLSCFSCGESLTGLFCHACGQKNDDYRRSIWALIKETFASVFSLENRMWRTWVKLITKPGMVAREFADGKRTSWTSPVRMYLALSIILFGYLGLTETRIFSIQTNIVPKAGFTGPVETLADASVDLNPDFGFFRRQTEIDRLNKGTDFQRVSKLLLGTSRYVFVYDKDLSTLGASPSDERLVSSNSWPDYSDTEERSSNKNDKVDIQTKRDAALNIYKDRIAEAVKSYNQILATSVNEYTLFDRLINDDFNESFDLLSELRLSKNENVKRTAEQMLQALESELDLLGLTRYDLHRLPTEIHTDFGMDLGESQINGVKLTQTNVREMAEEVLRKPALLNDGLSKYLPRIMFLMMPFAAFIGLIFIRGKKTALLYDHLVHATYIHAVAFAFLLVLIILSQWTPIFGLMQIFLLGVAIYLPLSAKTMFKRGWVKTIFASYGIALLYGFAMLLVVTLLTAGSIVRALEASQI